MDLYQNCKMFWYLWRKEVAVDTAVLGRFLQRSRSFLVVTQVLTRVCNVLCGLLWEMLRLSSREGVYLLLVSSG